MFIANLLNLKGKFAKGRKLELLYWIGTEGFIILGCQEQMLEEGNKDGEEVRNGIGKSWNGEEGRWRKIELLKVLDLMSTYLSIFINIVSITY